jgi:hypothetical protein
MLSYPIEHCLVMMPELTQSSCLKDEKKQEGLESHIGVRQLALSMDDGLMMPLDVCG